MPGWTWAASAPAAGAEWIGTAPHEELRARGPAQLPAEDPFYDPPAGFQHAAPGTVLRSRDVELAFLGLIPQKFTATQLLYRTTDMNGHAEAAATTVIMPAERAAARPRLRWSPTSARSTRSSSRCFPSYALRRRAVAPGALAQFEFLLITAALAEGWAVSVPDHEGRDGMWGAPYEPGYHVLDGAARRTELRRLGLSPTRRSACGATPAAAWPARGRPR